MCVPNVSVPILYIAGFNPGYSGEAIEKRLYKTEQISAAAAADYGVQPEEMEELFQGEDTLVAIHFF